MLKEEYVMNIETGEILTVSAAIRDFYKTHGALEPWTALWKFTGEEADSYLAAPNFAATVRI